MLVELASNVTAVPLVPIASTLPAIWQTAVIAGYGLNAEGIAGYRLFVGTIAVAVGAGVADDAGGDADADFDVCAADADASAGACSGPLKMPLAHRHEVTQALGLDRPDKALGIRVQVRASRRQAQKLHVPDARISLKRAVYSGSLSTIRWRASFRKPLAASVRLRATCAIHAPSGLLETPAT